MLHLYYKPTCPYCQKVLQANEQIKADLVFHDVFANENERTDLIAKGGKKQVPFLEDTDRRVMMYESDDIIAYLNEHYGANESVSVPDTANVCPID